MKALRKQGRIINLASVSALRGAPQSATRFAAAVFLASDRASHRHGDPSWWRHSHDIAADIAADRHLIVAGFLGASLDLAGAMMMMPMLSLLIGAVPAVLRSRRLV